MDVLPGPHSRLLGHARRRLHRTDQAGEQLDVALKAKLFYIFDYIQNHPKDFLEMKLSHFALSATSNCSEDAVLLLDG